MLGTLPSVEIQASNAYLPERRRGGRIAGGMTFLRFVQMVQRAFGQYQRHQQQKQRTAQQQQRAEMQALRVERLALERERLAMKRAQVEAKAAAPAARSLPLAKPAALPAGPVAPADDELTDKLRQSIERAKGRQG